mgnify:CR=1 FL=1
MTAFFEDPGEWVLIALPNSAFAQSLVTLDDHDIVHIEFVYQAKRTLLILPSLNDYSFVQTPDKNTFADQIMESSFIGLKK